MINFVPKQETCIKLKEAGMPQEGGELYYVFGEDKLTSWDDIKKRSFFVQDGYARAPLTDELLKPIFKHIDHLSNEGEWFKKKVLEEHLEDCLRLNHPSESLAQLILELRKEGVRLWPDNQGR